MMFCSFNVNEAVCRTVLICGIAYIPFTFLPLLCYDMKWLGQVSVLYLTLAYLYAVVTLCNNCRTIDWKMECLLHIRYNSKSSHSSLYHPKYKPPPLLSFFPTSSQLGPLVDINTEPLHCCKRSSKPLVCCWLIF